MPERRTGNCVLTYMGHQAKPTSTGLRRPVPPRVRWKPRRARACTQAETQTHLPQRQMRKNLPLISNQDFLERIQSVCPIKTQIISIYDCYHCGCQCIHSVGWNGGRIIRQTSLYEFVVFCPKGYLTLIEYSFDVHDVRSILSTKTNNHAALAQMEERPGSNL